MFQSRDALAVQRSNVVHAGGHVLEDLHTLTRGLDLSGLSFTRCLGIQLALLERHHHTKGGEGGDDDEHPCGEGVSDEIPQAASLFGDLCLKVVHAFTAGNSFGLGLGRVSAVC